MRKLLMPLLMAAVPLSVHAQVVPAPLDTADPRLEVIRPLVADMLTATPDAAEQLLQRHRTDSAQRENLSFQARNIIADYGGGRYRVKAFMRGPGSDIIVELNAVADNALAAFAVRTAEDGTVLEFVRVRFGNEQSGARVPDPAPTTPVSALMDDALKKTIVDSLARVVERFHTAPDTGRMIGDAVRRAERQGRYRDLDTQAFTKALTEDLRSVNGDRHLSVTSQAPAVRPGAPSPEAARLNNYGIAKAEYLDGNVGYLVQSGRIYGSAEARAAVAAALQYLADADALIIDMRGVPGGSAEMVNFLFSHFVPAGTPEVRVVNRINGTDEVRLALETVPAPRRTDIPLYVLIDGKSGSAAEALPFALQSAGRALVVGEPSGGAGRNNTFVAVGGGLWASVTFTRVSDPRTGREWEGTGVQPDVHVPADQALDAALNHARARLGRS